jgi:hypothetical protein
LLLLLVFAISAAPRAYFHDLLAGHKDFSTCRQVHKTPVLHTEGYNCHFDDVVVTAPFVLQPVQAIAPASLVFETFAIPFTCSWHPVFLQIRESRGPPSV